MSTPDPNGSRFGGNSNPSRPAQSSGGGGGGNVFTRKMGPLPLWAWMGLALAVAVIYSTWKKNSTASKSQAAQSITPPGSSPDQTTAASQIPQFVNLTEVQNAQSQSQTTNVAPPVAPQPPPVATPPPDNDKGPAPHNFVTVTVGKWPTGSGGNPGASENSFGPGTAAWNSTLWGIATHYNVPGGFQKLAQINGISNPNLIYPGQKIKVPVNNG